MRNNYLVYFIIKLWFIIGVDEMKFRLIDSGKSSAFFNMALDESVLSHIAEKKSLPTLRLYSWKPSAITLGYSLNLDKELNAKLCKEKKVDIVRRITGGGAVFHSKELTYSIIFHEDSKLVSRNIVESYAQICNALVIALKEFGLTAKFVPVNDVLVNGKKISGSAQTRKIGCVLQHGTILLEVDYEKMFSLLNVSSAKVANKGITNPKDRVTSLKEQLMWSEKKYDLVLKQIKIRQKISLKKIEEKLKPALIKGFEKALGITVEPGKISESELLLAEELSKTKYSKNSWNKMR
jgi:lipoate---protein ligase